MSLTPANIAVIAKVIEALRQTDSNRRLTLLSQGYPDLVVKPETLDSLLGEGFSADLEEHSDAEGIKKFKSRAGVDGVRAFETKSLFGKLNIDIKCTDHRVIRGDEIVADLNEPLDRNQVGMFDIVLDPGTIEHCFNVGTAMVNAASSVKVGGFIVHQNPLTKINHGFFNFSPTFFFDFYLSVGFEIVFMKAVIKDAENETFSLVDLPPTQKIDVRNVPDCTILTAAQRKEEKAFSWPIQTKYRVNPTLTG